MEGRRGAQCPLKILSNQIKSGFFSTPHVASESDALILGINVFHASCTVNPLLFLVNNVISVYNTKHGNSRYQTSPPV